jgi:hypothetical protein
MRATLILVIAGAVTGCGLVHSSKESPPADNSSVSTEVRDNGSPRTRVKGVYVSYSGPERLTQRFSKFFAIAAEDHRIKIVGTPGDADAEMEVTISEEQVQRKLKGEILHAGLLLRDGKTASIEYCEHVRSEGQDNSNEIADYSRFYAQGLVTALKESQPSAVKTFVSPIKGNVDPYFAEILRRELVKAQYVPAANAEEADVVFRTLGTTLEPFSAQATAQRIRIKITGSRSFSYDGNDTIYDSFEQPLPEKAKECLDAANAYLAPGYRFASDKYWNSAVVTATALAK